MEEPGRLQSMGSLSRTRLSDFTLTFHFHALEKEMAAHSSVLAWRIPGTGEPGELPSMGSHRVRHDWSDLAAAAIEERKEVTFYDYCKHSNTEKNCEKHQCFQRYSKRKRKKTERLPLKKTRVRVVLWDICKTAACKNLKDFVSTFLLFWEACPIKPIPYFSLPNPEI